VVKGIDLFREHFAPVADQYVLPFPHDIFGRNGLQERHSRARQCAPPSRRLTHPFFFTSGRSVDHL
jgi:hypothetical protein